MYEVGKTYRLLQDAHVLRRGRNVVVGLSKRMTDRHRRRNRRPGGHSAEGRRVQGWKMDYTPSARKPDIITSTSFRTRTPWIAPRKRWQDVEAILAPGFRRDRLNVQHLEGVQDVVRSATASTSGARSRSHLRDADSTWSSICPLRAAGAFRQRQDLLRRSGRAG
jgi:hypothetical protein